MDISFEGDHSAFYRSVAGMSVAGCHTQVLLPVKNIVPEASCSGEECVELSNGIGLAPDLRAAIYLRKL